jgi:aminopeptidase N
MALAAVDSSGRDVPGTATIVELSDAETTLEFRGIPEPAFMSYNRGVSFYGACRDLSASREALLRQVRLDPDLLNRVEAMRLLTDGEKIRLIEDPQASVSEDWLELFRSLVLSRELPHALRAFLLRIDEQTLDRSYLPLFVERWRARRALLRQLSELLMDDLLDAFHGVDTYRHTRALKDGVDARRLKAVLLELVTAADTAESQAVARDHFARAWHISDKSSALTFVYASSDPSRNDMLQEAYDEWHGNVSGYATYLRVIGHGHECSVFDRVSVEARRPGFRNDHPSFARALYLPVTQNNGLIWTDTGIQWLRDTVIDMASVNENTALRLVSVFQLVQKLRDPLRSNVLAALGQMRAAIEPDACPALAGRLSSFLSAPTSDI